MSRRRKEFKFPALLQFLSIDPGVVTHGDNVLRHELTDGNMFQLDRQSFDHLRMIPIQRDLYSRALAPPIGSQYLGSLPLEPVRIGV